MSDVNIPDELRYSKDHEWVKIEGDTAIVGISDYAQQEMHEVVFVDVPKIGKVVKQKDALCVIETMKAVSDVLAPVTGEVIEVNASLKDKPELVNSSPYDKGWIVKLKITGAVEEELKNLIDADAYRKHIGK